MIELVLESTHQTVSNDIWYIIWRSVFIEIQAYQYSNIISYLLKLAWHLLWQMTAPPGTSFDHVIETACTQTITILYKYFYIWGLDLRLNNINLHYLSLTSVLTLVPQIVAMKLPTLNHWLMMLFAFEPPWEF